MLTHIHPKLPMRNKAITKAFYSKMGFTDIGMQDFDDYLILAMDAIEIHFFKHNNLNPFENYGQVYIRTDAIDDLYYSIQEKNFSIHPNSPLQIKPWGQKEFSLLDPDHNLLTFGRKTP